MAGKFITCLRKSRVRKVRRCDDIFLVKKKKEKGKNAKFSIEKGIYAAKIKIKIMIILCVRIIFNEKQ